MRRRRLVPGEKKGHDVVSDGLVVEQTRPAAVRDVVDEQLASRIVRRLMGLGVLHGRHTQAPHGRRAGEKISHGLGQNPPPSGDEHLLGIPERGDHASKLHVGLIARSE